MPSSDLARPEDIPQLAELLELLFLQEADFQPDRSKQERALRMILDHPENGCILVVRKGDRILAMVNLLFLVSTAVGGKVILLEDMIVHPESRSQGIGSHLVREAIAYAEEHGYGRITLLTDRTNEDAIRFYQRHGFHLSAMVPLRLELKATTPCPR